MRMLKLFFVIGLSAVLVSCGSDAESDGAGSGAEDTETAGDGGAENPTPDSEGNTNEGGMGQEGNGAPGSGNVSFVPEISGCGGFGSNGEALKVKNPWRSPPDDPGPQCGDEKIVWSYDSATKTLTLTNVNVWLNCCGEHSVLLAPDVDGLIMFEKDEPEMMEGKPTRCKCMCFYDFRVTIENMDGTPFRLTIEREVTDSGKGKEYIWTGEIDLTMPEGEKVISEQIGWCE